MQAVQFAWATAAALAMVSAIFGVCIARVFWAGDLAQARETEQHAKQLKKTWDETFSSMNRTIEIQRETIDRLQGVR